MVVGVLCVLLAVHLCEVLAYSAVFALAAATGMGHLTAGGEPIGPLAYFYFSAETFSTAGYGDIVPERSLRIIAAIESLNGLLLLAWSGSFLFSLTQQR
jgi:hypothetical protein